MPTDLSKRPFMDFAALRDRFDRFFDDVAHGRRDDGSWSMAMDVHRGEDAITVKADVPGLAPDEIEITVEDGVLTIAGEHEDRSEEADEEGYVRRERHYGSFRRAMALPPEAKAEDIKATIRHGVVEVSIPLGEKPTGKKIEIRPTAA
jgi:HSP20 family protein